LTVEAFCCASTGSNNRAFEFLLEGGTKTLDLCADFLRLLWGWVWNGISCENWDGKEEEGEGRTGLLGKMHDE